MQSVVRTLSAVLISFAIAGCVVNAGSPTPLVPAANPPSNRDARSPLDMDWMITWIDGFSGDTADLIPLPGFIMTSHGTRVVGNTSCNQFSGGYLIDVETGNLRFTSLRNDRNLCQSANSEADDAILAALVATDGFEREGPSLRFLSKGREVMRMLAK